MFSLLCQFSFTKNKIYLRIYTISESLDSVQNARSTATLYGNAHLLGKVVASFSVMRALK